MNFIRKHTLELAAQGVERPSARLFSNPAGDFGSMVNERVSERTKKNECCARSSLVVSLVACLWLFRRTVIVS